MRCSPTSNHRRARLAPELTLTARLLCARYKIPPDLPHPHQMVVVTAGVQEGRPVDGVRHPHLPGARMCGWWLYDIDYPEDRADPDDFGPVHAFHLFEERPDVARFLALPAGWCFDTRGAGSFWFDQSVARQEAV